MSTQSLKPGWKMVKFGDIAQNVAVRVEPDDAELRRDGADGVPLVEIRFSDIIDPGHGEHPPFPPLRCLDNTQRGTGIRSGFQWPLCISGDFTPAPPT